MSKPPPTSRMNTRQFHNRFMNVLCAQDGEDLEIDRPIPTSADAGP